MPHTHTIAAVSLRGGRNEQQDRLLACRAQGAVLLLVADGMGGHKNGGLAASAIKKVAQKHFQHDPFQDAATLFENIVQNAWSVIRRYGAQAGHSPHTTVVMARVDAAGHAAWAHVGDSRLYLLSPTGEVLQRTQDHSSVALAVRSGDISEVEARHHPDSSLLYRSIGGDKPPKVTHGQALQPLAPGSILLLCSDGFWEYADYQSILALLHHGVSLPHALNDVARKAVSMAGNDADNTTAFVYVQ